MLSSVSQKTSLYLDFFSRPLPQTALFGYDQSFNSPPLPSNPSPLGANASAALDREPRILLVSMYLPLEKSKHSQGDYSYWQSKFLGSITTPVYFYTTPSLEPGVLSSRGSLPIHVNTSFTSAFEVPPLQGLQDRYRKMQKLDRETWGHNADLYAVWNAKLWLLDNAVQQLKREGEEYDYVFWNDAGSFRWDHPYTRWPDPKRVDEVWQAGLEQARAAGNMTARKEDILFFPLTGTYDWLRRYWREDDGPVDAEISEGSFFGGSPETMSWWTKVFYAYHDYWLQRGLFVGKDQTIFNSLFLLFPSRVIGVWISDPATNIGLPPRFDTGPLGACGNPWHYYQYFLASQEEQRVMRQRWMTDLEARVEWPWKGWKWWLKRQECRVTRVVWVQDMVNDAFGKGWGVRKTLQIP
ncbi:hypothetical protein D9756_005590 [Leucocoprinus leucothites]|uniref:Uncharacterized protein n=1 Tax=Leucocoprinus leucothites TaxID=201217 RepID=A0A8H5D9H2_9AGAR|nr:hypothetical protein D9756_005590 [Leucoagaricus leucothites]